MPPLRAEQIRELEALYRTTRDGRVRVRVLSVLLAADQPRDVAEIARVVRYHEETVRRWLTRYLAGGVAGLHDAPRPGAPPKATPAYLDELWRAAGRTPDTLGLPFSGWTGRRLADYLAERTGLRLSPATILRLLRRERRGDLPPAPHAGP